MVIVLVTVELGLLELAFGDFGLVDLVGRLLLLVLLDQFPLLLSLPSHPEVPPSHLAHDPPSPLRPPPPPPPSPSSVL